MPVVRPHWGKSQALDLQLSNRESPHTGDALHNTICGSNDSPMCGGCLGVLGRAWLFVCMCMLVHVQVVLYYASSYKLASAHTKQAHVEIV